jgi:probable F420-dependent oxidoreductase
MQFGISIFLTDLTIGAAEMAVAAEERGFESLWIPEHSNIPVSRETPWGGMEGAAPLPDYYARILDPFVALAAGAAVTSRLRLATGITLVAQRDHLWLAKEVASLDLVSQGRFLFGIGYGWNREEMASHGVTYSQRRKLVREKVRAMKALWTGEVASFEGELVRLEPSWAWPKPVQKPHPPIILGAAAGPRTITDLVDYCDGWIPLGRHELSGRLPAVRQALAEAGRDPATFEVTAYNTRLEAARLEELAELGVSRVVFNVTPQSPPEVLARLDEIAAFTATITG